MKLNNYSTYLKKDWKNNKGRFVNKESDPNQFILPIDDVSTQLLNYFSKIKIVVDKEYKNIHNYKYHNAELR
tara:strand:- start:372 stop:587 length:216 start_codon:yes stop_codon:yes gene_type:complete